MKIQTEKGKNIDIQISIKSDKGRKINFNSLSASDLVDVLEELSNEFLNEQSAIEMAIDNKCPDGYMMRNGEKEEVVSVLQSISTIM